MFRFRFHSPAAVLFAIVACCAPSSAATIIDDWPSVTAPPAPELKSVSVDPKTTALLVLDIVKQTCNADRRPRCVASLPNIAKLVEAARASGVMIVYTTGPSGTVSDVLPAVAPKGGEPVFTTSVDKFMRGDQDTGLGKTLKDRGVTTVIAVGTAAHGAVLYTASAAALRGFNVILPVDGMSGDGQSEYFEQYIAYHLTKAPSVSSRITLTSIDRIRF